MTELSDADYSPPFNMEPDIEPSVMQSDVQIDITKPEESDELASVHLLTRNALDFKLKVTLIRFFR
jgi:hypothetical protein